MRKDEALEDKNAVIAAGMTKDEALQLLQEIEQQINGIIIGQEQMVRNLLIGLFTEIPYSFKKDAEGKSHSGGCAHIILEGVPGVAKTLAVVAISNVIHAKFQRIQLAPDLLPADIVGTRVYDPVSGTFRVEHGPVFTNILLADEINRATPKTQSALLEAMQERQVTIGENTFKLEDPFWVLATQNPVEQEGVYVLPEAQLDRFSMMLKVGYPSHEDELKMLRMDLGGISISALVQPGAVIEVRRLIRETYVDDRLREYIVRLGRATRNPAEFGLNRIKEAITVGISPRAYHHLQALSKTVAFFHGRDYVLPSDVKEVGVQALQHRIIRSVQAEATKVTTDQIVTEILEKVAIP
ncbi:MAG: AAA family ATPase [Acidobacteria bacterium]|nr:AAA family ATPase [Acidobacteriota bacterium]